jgi:hypothetical protein
MRDFLFQNWVTDGAQSGVPAQEWKEFLIRSLPKMD